MAGPLSSALSRTLEAVRVEMTAAHAAQT